MDSHPKRSPLAVYLDCNASTPVEPQVLQRFTHNIKKYLGNYSANHARSERAALAATRQQMATLVAGSEEGIIFCASATEANNLAIQGLAGHFVKRPQNPQKQFGKQSDKRLGGHIIVTELEHISVRQPCEYLAQRHDLALSKVAPAADGRVAVAAIMAKLRPETELICCMQVNNETGVVQPVAQLAQALQDAEHPAYLHVDAVQGAAHVDEDLFPEASLRHPRIDLLSVSAHKMYGICGIAALLLKRRQRGKYSGSFPYLNPLLLGGGQQGVGPLNGLRSGSVPVALALSLGDAWELCELQRAWRRRQNEIFRQQFWQLLKPLQPQLNGAAKYVLPHVCNVILPGIDAESALLNGRSLFSAGRGAACSHNSPDSGVLAAMGLNAEAQRCSLRFSWHHHSPQFWSPQFWQSSFGTWSEEVRRKLQRLQV